MRLAFSNSARAPNARRVVLAAASTQVEAPVARATPKQRLLVPCRITGVGAAAPPLVLSNKDLESLVDTNDEWITTRTGIKRRHVLAKGETLTQIATKASESALRMAGVDPLEIDLVLFATSSPDDLFGNATQVQAAIGAKNACAFDLTAACSGFVLGLITAAQYIRTGSVKKVLLVAGDALSRYVDWKDRSTCILFGDGCGAVVIGAGNLEDECSVLGTAMHSDGTGHKSLHCMFNREGAKPQHEGDGPSMEGSYANIAMAGQEVFKFAVRSVPAVIDSALENAGLTKEDVDWLVMHQANQRILDAAATRLGLSADRVVSNLAEYGNTSAASIPLALEEAVRDGRIKKGDVVAMAGFGAGLTWASAIVRWG